MTNSDITHLTQAIMELKGQIERMSERQEEMVEDVKKIKEAVYNPDEGLYARLRELEQWKEITIKSPMDCYYNSNWFSMQQLYIK